MCNPSLRPGQPRPGFMLSVVAIGCIVFLGRTADSASEPLALRIVQGCETVGAAAAPPSGRMEAWELFLMAETLVDLNRTELADRFRLYLSDYYPNDPLLALLPPIPEETPYLSDFNPEPDFSRWAKNLYQDILSQPAGIRAERASEAAVLLRCILEDGLHDFSELDYSEFLTRYPESPYAGWAAYQMVWQHRQKHPDSSEGLAQFGALHRNHPLGEEALEAMDVQFFSPRHLAQLSSVLPGWGEEILEPGLGESAALLYYEALFWAGTIGFAVAAQQDYRVQNLTGALIFANLVIFNHRASAEKAYVLAIHRNRAEQRKFISERLDKTILGSGRFSPPDLQEPAATAAPLVSEWVPSVYYPLHTVAHGLAQGGWVENEQLSNLGARLEYLRSLWDVQLGGPWTISAAGAPFGRMFLNRAQSDTLDVSISEWSAGMELAWILRWSGDESWLQLRASAGPAFRQRGFSMRAFEYQEHGAVISGSLGLDWGGSSGSYWHVALVGDDSFRHPAATWENNELEISSRSYGIVFGMGLYF